jgi:chromosome segregation ATPase
LLAWYVKLSSVPHTLDIPKEVDKLREQEASREEFAAAATRVEELLRAEAAAAREQVEVLRSSEERSLAELLEARGRVELLEAQLEDAREREEELEELVEALDREDFDGARRRSTGVWLRSDKFQEDLTREREAGEEVNFVSTSPL